MAVLLFIRGGRCGVLPVSKGNEKTRTVLGVVVSLSILATMATIITAQDANTYTNTDTLNYYNCEQQPAVRLDCTNVWGTPAENQLKAVNPQKIEDIAGVITIVGWLASIMLYLQVND